MKKVYIVDSSSYIFRAFYAVTNLTTSSGFPTNALYGFIKMYLKLLSEVEESIVIPVFDAGKKNFRHEIYEAYKANRSSASEELKMQMPYFRDFVNALGMKVLEMEGFEADDIISTISKKATNLGFQIEVVTGDKDLMQLVNDNVLIWDTMKDKHYDAKAVEEKFDVPPSKISLYLAMVGDTSDNVPGIKGLGPKTVSAILKDYSTVDEVLASLDKISENKNIRGAKGVAEKILSSKDDFILSKKLVDLNEDVPLNLDGKNFEDFSYSDFENYFGKREIVETLLEELIQKFEFQSLFRDFNLRANQKEQKIDNDKIFYETVLKGNFSEFIENLKRQKLISFDTETTSLNIMEASLVGMSFCFDKTKAFYIPLSHSDMIEAMNQIDIDIFIKEIKPILENENIKKTGHNIKYDIEILKNYGVDVKGVIFDSMIAAYLLSPDEQSFSLSSVAKKYLGLDSINYKDVVGKKESFSEVSILDATRYSGEDAFYSWALYEKLSPKIKDENLADVFYKIDLPLIDVLVSMERNGVMVSSKMLQETSSFLEKEISMLEYKIYELAGSRFNINSPKQLAVVLFENLKISTSGIKKTQSGFSTDVNTLEKLKDKHEIANVLLKYRSLFKLKSTYVDTLSNFISSKTKRLHTKYNQAVAGTGRLSSSEPNLQNIPVRTTEGRKIRDAFLAPEGKVIISADYSQIELRVLAHMSQDEALVSAFKNNEDIHSNTSRFIFGLPQDETPTDMQRRLGKVINFGVVYGMSAFRLSKEINVSMKDATKYIEDFFIKYNGVKKYFDGLLKDIEEKGYVETMYGRKRFAPIKDENSKVDKGYLNRMAINAPIQGTAADIIKLAMINIQNKIQKENMPLKMIMQIHDELVFECDESYLNNAIEFIKNEMQGVVTLSLPLKVDIGYGISWNEAH